ncbi:hypothetical protein KDU71_16810 [Carboxylicivirga sediminis]|uniref:Uncharacterized protein n=1 Tax=Carboxylicivirga sediminis TaxID=2006564 RepID=A0A941F670_9BACT|nr:hypothetical protein [Carboxylicivirga sediminis]MBR8537232.1 hypothetical protein [Carboxylicivirga sediminis]
MSYNEDFNAWKEPIEAVPNKAVKLPNQPVDEFVAGAETLAVEATKDKEALVAAGLTESSIDELTPLAGALRHCQAEWMSEYRARQEAQKEWLAVAPAAFDERDELLHHFKFAYRNHADVLAKVMRINEGNGRIDMIQDLLELAVLGEKNPAPLTEIKIEATRLQEARTLSHHLSELLAQANGSADESSRTKLMRDKAYTLLLERVSKVREYGRYVFWKNEDRREKYYNNYKG